MNKNMTEQFKIRAGSPGQWLGSAKDLKTCADLIFAVHLAAVEKLLSGDVKGPVFAHMSIGRVFFLLAGLAIENLVKGLLVKRASPRLSLPSLAIFEVTESWSVSDGCG
jgi:hypothetical protein